MDTAIISLVCIAVLIVGMVTVTFNAFQAATSVADSLKEMEEQASDIRLTQISASTWPAHTVCVIAYQGSGGNGFLRTADIASGGQIADSVEDSLEFDSADSYQPSIVHISDDVYAIAYRNSASNGSLKTVRIAAGGQIADATIDTLVFEASGCYEPCMLHVCGSTYAIAYRGPADLGYLKTVQIGDDGQIADAVLDTLEFDGSQAYEPDLVYVSKDIFGIAYRGGADYGHVSTVGIAAGGEITDTVIDTLQFDSSRAYEPDIVRVAGDVYAIAYEGAGSGGYVTTVEITSDGAITDAAMDTLRYDPSRGSEPDMVPVAGGVYAIAHRGADSDGFLTTVEIAASGQITDTVIDSLEFDTADSYEPSMAALSETVYAVAYRDSFGAGRLRTVEIAVNGQITDTVIDTLQFDSSACNRPCMVRVRDSIRLMVTNQGQTALARYSRWDVIAQYRSGSTSYLTYLEYTTDNPPADNQWTVEGIYLPDETPEVYNLDILDPGEKMKLTIDLKPDIAAGTTGRITISTPNGVTAQCLVKEY